MNSYNERSPSLSELLAEKARVDAQIQMLEALERRNTLLQLRDWVDFYGFTPEEIFFRRKDKTSSAPKPRKNGVTSRSVKQGDAANASLVQEANDAARSAAAAAVAAAAAPIEASASEIAL